MATNCNACRGLVLVAVCLLIGVVVGHGFSQPTPAPLQPPPFIAAPVQYIPPTPQAPNPNEDLLPAQGPGVIGGLPAPDLGTMTFDQLAERVALLRKKKAELDQMEQAAVEQLRAKFREQKEKLSKLGIDINEPPLAPPMIPAPSRLGGTGALPKDQ
jgi:hypothetical protein